MKKCRICGREQELEIEGNEVDGEWYCTYSCLKNALENLIISKKRWSELTRK